MSETVAAWDRLYTDERFRLKVPSEDVVRFLATLEPDGEALDIGCGAGRHLLLLQEMGWEAVGVDASKEAVRRCERAELADMTRLPFDDARFQVAVAYGVFCYGALVDHVKAAAELHRVLAPKGRAFVCVRSNWDWRSTSLTSADPEAGMEMNFLTEAMLLDIYGRFGEFRYEWREWTTDNRRRRNSDWLITVEK